MAKQLTEANITNVENLPDLYAANSENASTWIPIRDITGRIMYRIHPSKIRNVERWSAKIYYLNPTIVAYGDKTYLLKSSTVLPFTSTNFATELADGTWISSEGHVIVDGDDTILPSSPKLKFDGIPVTTVGDATYIDLYLKAMQNVGVCQACPILPIDIVIDTSALTLTIATVKGGTAITAANPIRFFTDGGGVITKYEKAVPQVFTFTKTTGIWYFYFNSAGAPIVTQVPWSDFATIAPIYRFYLNATKANADMIVVRAWEAHLNDISASDHAWKHALGTIYLNGFDIVDNRLATGAPNADGRNTVISLTGGTNSDDGLQYTVISDTTPTGKFEQDLGHTTAATLNATNSGLFKIRTNSITGVLDFLPATRFPFAWDTGTNRPEYITSTGVRTLVGEDRFFVYYIYGLQDDAPGEALKVVSAQVDFATLTDAQAHQWEQLQTLYPTLRDNEIRPKYKGIWLFNATVPSAFDVGCKYSALREVTDIRKTRVTTTSTSGGSVLDSNVVTSPPAGYVSTNQNSLNAEFANNINNYNANASRYQVNSSTVDSDPGVSVMRYNTATPESSTFIYLSDTSLNSGYFKFLISGT